jgi:hypothetical protein
MSYPENNALATCQIRFLTYQGQNNENVFAEPANLIAVYAQNA